MEGWTDISSESLMGRIRSLPYTELSLLFSELITNLGFQIMDIHADVESLNILAKSHLGDSYYIKVQDFFDKEGVKKAVEEAGSNAKTVLVALSGNRTEEIMKEITNENVEFVKVEKLIELAKGYDIKNAIERLITNEDIGVKEKVGIKAEVTSEVTFEEKGRDGLEKKELNIELNIKERYAKLTQPEKDEFINKLIEDAKTDFNLGNKEDAYRNYESVLKLEPKHVEALQGAADALLSLERYEDAIGHYNKLLELAPENALAWYDKGVALGHLGRYKEEIECYQRVLRITPDDTRAQNNLGVALQMIGKNDDALRIYDAIISTHPTNAEAWNNKGVLLKKEGRYPEAIKCYNRAIELSPNRTEAYLNKGLLLMEQARYSEAVNSFATLLVSNPNDEKALFALGRCKMLLGGEKNLRAALEAFEKVLKLNPNLDEGWDSYWEVVDKLGKFGYTLEEVLAEANAELRIEPHSMHAWFKKGKVHYEKNEIFESLEAFEKVLLTNPYFLGALEYKGRILESRNDLEGALKCYEEYTKTEPGRSKGWLLRGRVLQSLGRLDEAIACFSKALGINPKDSEVLYNLGYALEMQGKLSDAIERYKDAIGVDASNQVAFFRLGKALFSSSRYEEALEVFEYILKNNPEDTKAMFERGKVLIELGRIEDAEKILKRLIELEPNNLDVLFALGAVLESEGKYQDALACYESVSATPSKDAVRLWANRGRILFNQGMLEESIKCMNESIRLADGVIHGKELSNMYTDLGIVNYYLGRYEDAIFDFEHAVSISKKNLRAMVNRGNALYMLGRISEAHGAYDEALKKDKNYLYGLSQKEIALFNDGKYEESLEYAEKIIKEYPTCRLGWYAKGRALEALGRKEESRVYFDKVIMLDPESQEARDIVHELLMSHEGVKNPSMMLDRCEETLAKYPSEPRLIHAKAQALYFIGEYERAYETFTRLLASFTDKDSPIFNQISNLSRDEKKRMLANVQNDLACVLYFKEKYSEARELLEKAIKELKTKEGILNYACVLYKMGDFEESMKMFKKGISEETYSYCKNGVACILSKLGKYEEAKKEIDEVLLKRDESIFWTNRGYINLSLGNYKEGYYDFENAIRKSVGDKNYSAIFGRMFALVYLGKYQDAIRDGLELAKVEEYKAYALNCVGYCYQQLFHLEDAIEAYEKSGTEDSIYSKLCVLYILRRYREILELVEKNPSLKERAEEILKVVQFYLGGDIGLQIDEMYLLKEYKQPKRKSFMHSSEFSAM